MCSRKKPPQTDKALGIDLGLKDFLIISNGEVVSNLRTLAKYKNKVARLNKRVAKKSMDNYSIIFFNIRGHQNIIIVLF